MAILTLSQFSTLHLLSNPTVIKYLKNDQILGFKIGARWYINSEESDRYFAEGLLPLNKDESND